VLSPHDRGRLFDAVAFQQGEQRVLLPGVVALSLVEVEHQGTQLCQDGLCCGVPVVSAQVSCKGESLLQPDGDGILFADEALQRMAVRNDRARACQLVAEDVHVDVTRLHELVGGEPFACQFRLGSRDEKRVRPGDKLLELCLARGRIFASVQFPENGFEVFLEPG